MCVATQQQIRARIRTLLDPDLFHKSSPEYISRAGSEGLSRRKLSVRGILAFSRHSGRPRPHSDVGVDMPRVNAASAPRQKCYCPQCNGATLPWSSWSRHNRELQQRQAELQKEIQRDQALQVAPPDPEQVTNAETEKDFANIKSKRQQNLARMRATLLSIHHELTQLQVLRQHAPLGLVFCGEGKRPHRRVVLR